MKFISNSQENHDSKTSKRKETCHWKTLMKQLKENFQNFEFFFFFFFFPSPFQLPHQSSFHQSSCERAPGYLLLTFLSLPVKGFSFRFRSFSLQFLSLTVHSLSPSFQPSPSFIIFHHLYLPSSFFFIASSPAWFKHSLVSCSFFRFLFVLFFFFSFFFFKFFHLIFSMQPWALMMKRNMELTKRLENPMWCSTLRMDRWIHLKL